MTDPGNAVVAATHPGPYPYYARLVRERPLAFDDELNCWVAASAEVVTAVLEHGACRVRPASEPVPRGIASTEAGEVFRNLVRMNDGELHCPMKRAISSKLEAFDSARAREAAIESMRMLDGSSLDRLAFRLPAYTVATFLGIPAPELVETAILTGDFVASIAPGASAEAVERGAAAARRLTGKVTAVTGPDVSSGFAANLVGLLSQSYEATAGTIGTGFVALARRPAVRAFLRANPESIAPFVAEVVRYDAPVQNTRRWLARDAVIGGQAMKEGDAILVLLGAANRDPAANREPDRFDVHRADRRHFTFGVGAHACPGAALALTIAEVAVEWVLERGIDLSAFAGSVTYRPSVNVRIPVLVSTKEAAR